MKLETRRIELRPVQKADLTFMYSWRNSDSYREYFQGRRNIVTWEEFELEYKKDMERLRQSQFLIWLKREGKPIGLVYSYSYNQTDGNMMFGTFIESAFQERGYGAEASILFLKYLFDTFPIRKVSVDIYGYNSPSLSGCNNLGFVKEGEFREHRFYYGKYWNTVRMAMLRSETDRVFRIYDRLIRY